MKDNEKLQARAAFVAKIKMDDEHRDSWAKTSVKAHWTGPLGGFASDGLNRRWDDFLSGWSSAKADIAADIPPAAPCTWTKSPDPHMPDTFNATCGVVWTFTDGGPAENDVRFCPGCGADVSVAAPEPEKDLYDLAVKADNGGQP